MPSLPKSKKRPWIPERQKKRNQEHNKKYDTPAWRRLRKQVRKEEPICRLSKDLEDKIVASEMVDHIKPERFFPELFYERSNLMALSNSMHAKKNALESKIHSREQWNREVGSYDNLLIILSKSRN